MSFRLQGQVEVPALSYRLEKGWWVGNGPTWATAPSEISRQKCRTRRIGLRLLLPGALCSSCIKSVTLRRAGTNPSQSSADSGLSKALRINAFLSSSERTTVSIDESVFQIDRGLLFANCSCAEIAFRQRSLTLACHSSVQITGGFSSASTNKSTSAASISSKPKMSGITVDP